MKSVVIITITFVLLIPLLILPSFAESQTLSTNKGTLEVKLSYDEIILGQQTKLNIEFINLQTKKVQEHIDDMTQYKAPLRQIRDDGVLPKDVKCNEGLELIFRSNDSSSACVKPETKNELDWRAGIPCLVIMTDKEKYKIDETVNVTVKNNCAKPLFDSGDVYITIVDSKGTAYCCGRTSNGTILKPGETDYEVWVQMSMYKKVYPGMYKIISHVPLASGNKETSKWVEIID